MAQKSPPLHFSSLDAMLEPEALAQIAGLAGNSPTLSRGAVAGGLSGASMERIAVRVQDSEQRFVIKQVDPARDWLMIASGDTLCREVQFARSPLSAQLSPDIVMPVLATAYTDHAGTLLMADVSPALFDARMCYEPADEAMAARIVDHLAAMHARFWEHPMLAQSEWLATPFNAMFALTPVRLQLLFTQEQSGENTYGRDALKRWFHLWHYLDPADAAALQHVLAHPDPILRALQSAPPTLAHGDAWLANMGEDEQRLILLDWALATAGPATYDSLWFAHTWHSLDPDWVLATHRAALLRYGIAAVADDATWALLADLGWVRTTLMGIEWLVREILISANSQERDKA